MRYLKKYNEGLFNKIFKRKKDILQDPERMKELLNLAGIAKTIKKTCIDTLQSDPKYWTEQNILTITLTNRDTNDVYTFKVNGKSKDEFGDTYSINVDKNDSDSKNYIVPIDLLLPFIHSIFTKYKLK